MKTNDCEIVKDLLPLYVEDLLSPESRKFVGEHLPECEDCRNYLEKCLKEVDAPVKTPEKLDRKIRRGIRFRMFWYIFWPSLYATCLQFNKSGTLRFFTVCLVVVLFGGVYSQLYMYSVDTDDSKKDFYQRENENIRQGRGMSVVQGLMWSLPILVPVVIGAAGAFFKQ